jgi:cytochrome c oxidase subunit II
VRRGLSPFVVAVAALTLTACDPALSMLDTRGTGAERINILWWLMFWLGTAVFVAVMILLLLAHRAGSRHETRSEAPLGDIRFILIAGAAIPMVILMIVMIPTFQIGTELSRIPERADPVIEVIGHQFWWEIRYPDHGVITANEIHVPAGRAVEIILNTRDVIHSFWIPEVGGKLDMIPGRENRTWIEAHEPGVYRGFCAEFCGIQHARMELLLVAQTEAEFAAWIRTQQQVATLPEDPLAQRGLEVYFQADCHLCHAIRGVVEPTQVGSPGPDLTHFATRLTLGSAIMENNRGNLGGWLLNPQQRKPGNRMPRTFIDPESLHALLAYMETLR